jgi:hypothetical protein
MYVQVETNYPRPRRYAAHPVMIVRQMWQPHMQLCDHGIEVVEDLIRELLFSQFIPYMILRIELRYVPGQGRQPDIFRYGLGPLKRGGNRNRGTTNDGRQESRTVCHRTSAGSPSGYLSELPLTPIAPIRTPAWSTIGRPPGKVMRPSLEVLDPEQGTARL